MSAVQGHGLTRLRPADTPLPALPARLSLIRLLLEHSLHAEALDIVHTVRDEDSEEVEGAYLEGWAWYLRAEAMHAKPPDTAANGNHEDTLTAEACFSEAMRALMECAKLYAEQEYEDEGIGAHVAELLQELESRGTHPAEPDEEDEEGEPEDGSWEDADEDDAEMT